MTDVTCHTDGCANAGIRIPMQLDGTDELGDPWAADVVLCGVCGNEITDLGGEPAPADESEEA